jgi:uncharacterized membrane protein YdjX (TVP38/TMEM64 family)
MLKTLFSKAGSSIFLLIYLGLMPTLLGGAMAGYVLSHQEVFKNMDAPTLFLLNIGFAVVLAIGWMPTTFFSMLCGYLWGWESLHFVVLSYVLASVLGYFLCKWLDRGRLQQVLAEKFPVQEILGKLEKSGFWLAVFCRLSPTLPFAVLNALFAMAKYPFYQYMAGGTLGMLPRTVFALFVGAGFSHVHHLAELKTDASIWFALALFVLSSAGLGWLVKKRLF